jgi:hypothetical protein
MKMKVSGLPNVELVGDIAGVRESDGYLTMTVRLSKPVGWQASAALTHKDLMSIGKQLLLRPSNLFYVLFGFAQPGRSEPHGI